jgi:NAD(P)-dependent dehydrogenase (short-subunit alcohol dehydrogenase family)
MSTLTYPLGGHDDLQITAKLVEAQGRQCLAIPLDVRDASSLNAAVTQTVEKLGRVDIALASAGVVSTGPLVEVSDEAWQELIDTNLTGVFHTLRAVIPVMRQQQFGRIVVTSSMAGRMGIPNLAAYGATKWAVIGLAKSVALEVAKDGITVNVICPTTTHTPMVQPDPEQPVPDDVVRQFLRGNPIPRPWIQPEHITRTVLHLVSDPGTVTGAVFEIGLGSSARMH